MRRQGIGVDGVDSGSANRPTCWIHTARNHVYPSGVDPEEIAEAAVNWCEHQSGQPLDPGKIRPAIRIIVSLDFVLTRTS